MLLDLLPLFQQAETPATVVAGGGAVRYPNPLPQHRPHRRIRDDEEALLVAALI